ncbi:hypothetical protein ABTE74_21585, partial [Acinetobacter baumannii]
QLCPALQDEVIRRHTRRQGDVRQIPRLAETAADIQRGTHRMQGKEAAEGIHHFPWLSFLSNFMSFPGIHNSNL